MAEAVVVAAPVAADVKIEDVKTEAVLASKVEETKAIDVEGIKAAYKAELDSLHQTEIATIKTSSYDEGGKAAVERLKAVVGACSNDHALALQFFEQGMDVGKAKESYSRHIQEMAAKRIPVGVNQAAKTAASVAVKSFFDKWNDVRKK